MTILKMSAFRMRFAVMVFAAALLLPSTGLGSDADGVAVGVQKKYAALQDLSAGFRQESKVVSLGRTRHKEGTIRFKRSGLMRWDYVTPDQQLILSDGKRLWFYRPAKRQVVVQDLSQAFANQTPLLFLFGEGDLSAEFTWDSRVLTADEKGNYLLELTPRRETPDLVGLTLEVRREDFSIAATVLRDAFGNVTRLEFFDEQENQKLADDLFTFAIPPGTEVLKP